MPTSFSPASSNNNHSSNLHRVSDQEPCNQNEQHPNQKSQPHQHHGRKTRCEPLRNRRRFGEKPKRGVVQVQQHHHVAVLPRRDGGGGERAAGKGQGWPDDQDESDGGCDHGSDQFVEFRFEERFEFWGVDYEQLLEGTWAGEDIELV